MNIKTYKFYKGIFELAETDYYNDPAAVARFFRKTLEFDFDIAAELWDYLITDALNSEVPAEAAAGSLGDNVLAVMIKKNASKTYRCIVEKETVAHALYAMPDMPGPAAKDALVHFLMGAKLEDADAALKAMQKSANYGAAMKELLEKLFEEIKKKTDSAKVTMPKKTAEFLRANIAKIKSKERALVEQRIKEIL